MRRESIEEETVDPGDIAVWVIKVSEARKFDKTWIERIVLQVASSTNISIQEWRTGGRTHSASLHGC